MSQSAELESGLHPSERRPLMISSDSFGISSPNASAISQKIGTSTFNPIQNLLPKAKFQQEDSQQELARELKRT